MKFPELEWLMENPWAKPYFPFLLRGDGIFLMHETGHAKIHLRHGVSRSGRLVFLTLAGGKVMDTDLNLAGQAIISHYLHMAEGIGYTPCEGANPEARPHPVCIHVREGMQDGQSEQELLKFFGKSTREATRYANQAKKLLEGEHLVNISWVRIRLHSRMPLDPGGYLPADPKLKGIQDRYTVSLGRPYNLDCRNPKETL